MQNCDFFEQQKMLCNIDAPPIYPCVYREHGKTLGLKSFNNGLSLCIQGTLLHLFDDRLRIRFIPVHTGNSYVTAVKNITATVYPCAYREHNDKELPRTYYNGLSLCIQGTRQLFSIKRFRFRFIPVHTGNTNCL